MNLGISIEARELQWALSYEEDKFDLIIGRCSITPTLSSSGYHKAVILPTTYRTFRPYLAPSLAASCPLAWRCSAMTMTHVHFLGEREDNLLKLPKRWVSPCVMSCTGKLWNRSFQVEVSICGDFGFYETEKQSIILFMSGYLHS